MRRLTPCENATDLSQRGLQPRPETGTERLSRVVSYDLRANHFAGAGDKLLDFNSQCEAEHEVAIFDIID